MSLYAFHLGQIFSTVLGHVDHGGQDSNAARTRIRDETSETDHTQRRHFCNGAISRNIKALAILRCLYGSEMVLLGGWSLGSVKLLRLIFLKKMDIWHTHDYMSICGLRLEINSSGPILGFFLNLFDRNIIGVYLTMLLLIWCKTVNIL